LEKTITVSRLPAMPDGVRQQGETPYGKKKSYTARHEDEHARSAPKRIIEPEPDGVPASKGMPDSEPQEDERKHKKSWADKPRPDKAKGEKRSDIGRDQKPRDEKRQSDGSRGVTHGDKKLGDKPFRAKRPEDKKSYRKKPKVKTGSKTEGKKHRVKIEGNKPRGDKPSEKVGPKTEGKKPNKKTKRATLTLKGTTK
jgi:hypothetical protein